MWRLIKYFAKAGEPRQRAESSPAQPPPARSRCPEEARAGRAPRLGPSVAPRGSAGLSRSPDTGHGSCASPRSRPSLSPGSGTVPPLPRTLTRQLRAGSAGRAPAPEGRSRRGGPPGWALPSARRQPGTAAAFKVCFWSVLWFAGEKACLQTAAGELSRRGEEARLCQRRTKPPNSSKLS